MKKQKPLLNINILASILLIMIAVMTVIMGVNVWILSNLQTQMQIPVSPQPMAMPDGYVEADVDIYQNTVMLVSGCQEMTATVTDDQAKSIEAGLGNITSYRPLTHDTMRDILEFFNISILAVRIDKMENKTYFGRLLLQQGDNGLSLDIRPSDGIALALRTNTPIWVNQTLFDEHGVKIC